MKKLALLLIALTMLTVYPSCGPNQKEALTNRATQWVSIFPNLGILTEDEAISQIESFLEPLAAQYDIAKGYYESWTSSHWNQDGSVDEIIIDPDGEHGTVRITVVAQWVGPAM